MTKSRALVLLVMLILTAACGVVPTGSTSPKSVTAKALDKRVFTAQDVAAAFGQVMNQTDATPVAIPSRASAELQIIPAACAGAGTMASMFAGSLPGWQGVEASDTGILFKIFDDHASAAAFADPFDALASPTCSAVQINDQRVQMSSSDTMKPLVQQGRSWGLQMSASGSSMEIGMWEGGNIILLTGRQTSQSTETPPAMDPGAMLNLTLTKLGIS